MDQIREMVYAKLFGEIDDLIKKVEQDLPQLSGKFTDDIRKARNEFETSILATRTQLQNANGELLESLSKVKSVVKSSVDSAVAGASTIAVHDIKVLADSVKTDMAVIAKETTVIAIREGVGSALHQSVKTATEKIAIATDNINHASSDLPAKISAEIKNIGKATGKIIKLSTMMAFIASLLGTTLALVYVGGSQYQIINKQAAEVACNAAYEHSFGRWQK